MKTFASLALIASLASLTAPASAQFAKPEDAIKYRQNAFYVMSQHFGRIGAMTSGKLPFDAKFAAESAAIVADMAKLPSAAFGAGTEQGGNTRAKPEIWTEQVKFRESNDKMLTESVKLAAVAKTGDLGALKAAFGATADTCKSCHDAFRNK
jgi:cytochrome c556